MLHKFEFDGSRVVLDVHSGVVHVVDELVWTLLDDCRQMSGESIIQKHSNKYSTIEILEACHVNKYLRSFLERFG